MEPAWMDAFFENLNQSFTATEIIKSPPAPQKSDQQFIDHLLQNLASSADKTVSSSRKVNGKYPDSNGEYPEERAIRYSQSDDPFNRFKHLDID